MDSSKWNVLKSRIVQLTHLNTNSILPKLDKLRYKAKSSNASVIGISKSRLAEFVLQLEIQINSYYLLCLDRIRNAGGVSCYIISDISYIQKQYFPENFCWDSKTKQMVVVIIHWLPTQNEFLKTLNKNFLSINTDVKEASVNNSLCKQDSLDKISSTGAKKYHQFCTMHGLKQLIQCPNRVICPTSTLADHILGSFPSRVSQKGGINVGMSDHQLIFRAWKMSKFKTSDIHKHINFCSFEKYRDDDYKKILAQLVFKNYTIFDNLNTANSHFFQKIMAVIDKIVHD